MKIVDFRIPADVKEARSILKDLGPQGAPLAGGTSLGFLPGREPKVAVDITRLELSGISRENGTFRIGATTRIADLQKHSAEGWVLDGVAKRLASQQIRNMSTLGGNIARVFPWADFPVVLMALDAVMAVSGDVERRIPAAEYFASQPTRFFGNGELLTAVLVKAIGPGQGFGYRKETRAAMGFSLTTVAAFIELTGNAIAGARIAIGAGVPFPARVAGVEKALIGKVGSAEVFREAATQLAGLKFKGSAGLSDEYTAHLAQVLVADALADAWAQAKGAKR